MQKVIEALPKDKRLFFTRGVERAFKDVNGTYKKLLRSVKPKVSQKITQIVWKRKLELVRYCIF